METQDSRAVAFWFGRETLRHRRAIGFEHLGNAQQSLFRFSNGFHSFTEPLDYEVVWPHSNEMLTTRETVVVSLDQRPIADVPVRKAPVEKRLTVRQQEARLPDVERVEEPVAAVVHVRTPSPLSDALQIDYDFGAARIAMGAPVHLQRGQNEYRSVMHVDDLRRSFEYGWRVVENAPVWVNA